MKNFKEFLIEARRTDKIDKINKLFDEKFKGTSFTTDNEMSGSHSFEILKDGKNCGEVSSMRIMGKQSTYVLLNGLKKTESNKILKIANEIFSGFGLSSSEKEEGTWGIKQYYK